jgi:isopenicillin N synthase-like dioxygenase
MAVVLPSNSSEHGFSISNIISRFRSKKRTKSKPVEKQTQHHTSPEKRPPFIPSPLPLILPQHQHALPTLGWTTITFPQPQDPSPSNPHPSGPHPLQTAYRSLFVASQAFFDLPASTKSQWKHKLGSEEGWSSIPGEKEFITLRSLEYCPDILREPAKTYWDLMGTYLTSSLSRIATSLAMSDAEALTRFVGPCASMQSTDALKTATMLRLFRYEGWDAKVVAEPHSDLGLLSVVVGNVPGLEVWDGHAWFDVEREMQRAEMQGASLLVGRQLERLSNGRYSAGGHRVVSYGAAKPAETQDAEKRYRFSIVFVLRAHEPVVINSDELETEVTGKWDEPLKGTTAGKMYDEIRGRHYNINIGVEEREKQRRNVEMRKVG